MPCLPPDSVPVRLPHYQLRDGGLYFLISRRPVGLLDPREQEVWESLDGSARVRELTTRFPGGAAEAALGRFVAMGACLPVEADFPAGRRRVLIVEPHMDDAVLSLGGTLWRRRRDCEFTILTLAGRNIFTSYGYVDREYFDVDVVSALRRAESALVARALGGRHLALDLPEAPLRYRDGTWTLEWFHRHRAAVSAFIGHVSSPAELGAWTESLRQALGGLPADEVWMPIGVGPHTDHQLTRNACLTLMAEGAEQLAGRDVRLYQEVPYAARFPGFTAAIVEELTRCGAELELERVPVAEAFPDKLRLVSCFGSQFKLEAMREGIEAAARAAAGATGGLAEILYRVVAPPRRLDFPALFVGAAAVKRLAAELGPWLARHRRARRVHLFVRPPAGRWAEDMQLLLDALPEAHFDVRMGDEAMAEILEFDSPRVRVSPVGSGAPAWAMAALRATLGGPAPTLVLPCPHRMRDGHRLRALMPLSDTLVVPDMNHLALAMRTLAKGDTAPSRAAD